MYSLGHLEEAKKTYKTVIEQFPESYKVEASQYKFTLIDLRQREQELLKLLKTSHEEYLRALEDSARREKTYEQAIISYQKKLIQATAEDVTKQLLVANDQLQAKTSEISSLRSKVDEQTSTIGKLQNQIAGLEKALKTATETARDTKDTVPASVSANRSLLNQEALLKLKSSALDLKILHRQTSKGTGGQK